MSCALACGPADAPAEEPADAAAPTGERPSIVMISLDTTRADHTSLYGYERETTPYLERLAAESVVYERALSPVPWTLPSHLTMFTGLHPREHGVLDGERALSEQIPTLAERLSEAGWRTAGVHNSGWVHPRHGFARGFDSFVEHTQAEQGLAELERVADELVESDQPYFVFAHFFDAHSQNVNDPDGTFYEPPAPYDTLYLPDAAERVRALPEHRRWHTTSDFDAEGDAALVALYDGGIRYLDDVLERWLEGWRARGLLDNTLILITADHGEALNQRGLLRGHGGFFQEGLHVPFLLRFPDGARGGERSSEPVALVDIVPTVLAAAGLPTDPELAGFTLTQRVPGRRVQLCERDTWRSIVQWPRKLVVSGELATLIDLEHDPLELNPVLLEEGERTERLREFTRLLRAQERGRPQRFPEPLSLGALSDEARAGLQALGYLDADEH
ncbi:MAG: hypothetical protein DHS20C15_26030 [Planctomycetota bacterium]|nr:MAG: hypothetical protein DHS20C15_26030 [Planctomycetota bacterium]